MLLAGECTQYRDKILREVPRDRTSCADILYLEDKRMIIGNKTFESGKEPYVMGILNVTPDSFRMEDSITPWTQLCLPQRR